jgi:hypothetical protein
MIQTGTPVVVTSGSLCAEPGIVVGAERPFVVVEIPRLGTRCMVLADDLRFVAEHEARREVFDAIGS